MIILLFLILVVLMFGMPGIVLVFGASAWALKPYFDFLSDYGLPLALVCAVITLIVMVKNRRRKVKAV